MPKRFLALLTLICAVLPSPGRASSGTCDDAAPASVSVQDGTITLAVGCVWRQWDARSVVTLAVGDARSGWASAGGPDFTLSLDGLEVPSDVLLVNGVSVAADNHHASVRWSLLLPGVAEVERTVDAWTGVAGFAARTSITSLAPLALSGYTLDRVAVGEATPRIHEFRAGSDWRDANWNPPSIGDNHAGDWRETHSAPAGSPLTATGEWASVAVAGGPAIGIVNERRDYASSVGRYDGKVVSAGVDLSRDVVYLGPFEEGGHVENPGPGPARHRAIEPGVTLALEPSFTIVGRDIDDEAWQFWKYLTRHRSAPYPKRVVFNSDQVDRNQISTGAKDDMNYERFLQILPAAREIGADTFVFDDGWMARAGDWCPDSPACTEPRWDGDPESKFSPRFPDDHFGAVQQALKGDPDDASDDIELGLWMNPMAYHPSSKAFQTNPQWSCMPVGTGTGAVSIADPDGGSNEAGIGLWNPRALGVHPDDPTRTIRMIDYLEERIRRAIDVYGSRYFKFDFLVWVDCGGAFPVTMYEYHDEFVAMIDRIQRDRPSVTFQIDDTNDHRMFPFETIARGPSWYLNGHPSIAQTLHTVWTLAPYVPGSALGLRSISSGDRAKYGVDAVAAAAITSHLTISMAIDDLLTSGERARVKTWTDFYHANSASLAGFTYPLLADPALGGWTALQPWDRDAQSGWVLAYRQDDASPSVSVPLRGLDAAQYSVTYVDPAMGSAGAPVVVDGATLRTAGLPMSAASAGGYAFARVIAL